MYGQPSRKLARTLLAAGAILAGCSEAPNPAEPIKPNFAVGDLEDPSVELGKIKICKLGNTASGTFTVTGNPNATVVAGECRTVAENLTPPLQGPFVITETSAGFLSATITRNDAGVVTGPVAFANGGTVTILNNAHGYTITFTNFVAPPPPPPPPATGCTYTKGWYQNKNGAPTIVLTIDGRTPNQQRAIFEASPGQPGSVTWGVGNKPNNLLNLYQQLLAAINNLDGNLTAGPAAVDVAIAAALAGTGGTVLNITTTLTGTQISDLINVLSAFNEGTFAGWPHCDDEVLAD